MTVNHLAETTVAPRVATRGRRLLTLSGVVGVGYSISWIAGLSVRAPSPAFHASGSHIVNSLAGHHAAVALQFALTEGLPAVGIAIVSIALARAARDRGAMVAPRIALISGMLAALISLAQFALGMILVRTESAGTAHLIYGAVNRMDGVKMLTLAVLGVAGAAAVALPRWLRWTGSALAVSIAVSGVVYLLLLQNLSLTAGPALMLLLVFITGIGVTVGAAPTTGG